MALSKDEHDLLVDCLSFVENESDKLNDFEKSFLTNQQERYDEYGENIKLSPKQIAVLEKVYNKVVHNIKPKFGK